MKDPCSILAGPSPHGIEQRQRHRQGFSFGAVSVKRMAPLRAYRAQIAVINTTTEVDLSERCG